MKWFSENKGIIAKVTVVLGLIGAIVTLNWKYDDKIDTKVGAAEIRIEKKIDDCVEKSEIKLAGVVDKVQTNARTQGVGLRADLIRLKLEMNEEKLEKDPNNPVLIEERRRLQERLEELTDKIDEILTTPIE
jgi:hypothetical protein